MLWKKRLLSNSKLYLILDAQVNDHNQLFEIAKKAMNAGVTLFQLRDKKSHAKKIMAFSKRMQALTKKKALYVINDRVDIAMACDADGVHLGQDDLSIEQARKQAGSGMLIGASAQTYAHAQCAQKQGADYIGFGSVFRTLTKPDREPMDLSLLRKVVRNLEIPVFAIGGIGLKHLSSLQEIGVNRVAVCRAICCTGHVTSTAKQFMKRISLSVILLGFIVSALTGCASLPVEQVYGVTKLPEPERHGVYHKVLPGQTLWRIAKTYNVSIRDIIEINNIPDAAQVEVNQLILIPGVYVAKDIILDQEQAKNDFIWPVKGRVIHHFRQNTNGYESKGVDIRVSEGTVVKAARTGRVVFADELPGYGHTVILDHSDGYHSVYAQNAELFVKLGDLVFKNNEIARVGRGSDLAYLHFQIRKNSVEDNPLYYLP